MRPLTWLSLLLLTTLPALARLGGGGSYRSSSSSSSSGSSSSYSGSSSSSWGGSSSGSSYSSSSSRGDGLGLGDLFVLLVILGIVLVVMAQLQKSKDGGLMQRLNPKKEPASGGSCLLGGVAVLFFLANPALLGLVALVYFVVVRRVGDSGLAQNLHRGGEMFAGLLNAGKEPGGARAAASGQNLEELLRSDPNFSMPVFREFAVLLYCQAMQERPGGAFLHSRPYLTPKAAETLKRRSQADSVSDVVVGTCFIRKAQAGHANLIVSLTLEANYIEQHGAQPRAFVARENWTLERRLGLLTKPPKAVNSLACPSCGFSGDIGSNGICPQCGTTNVRGDFDWVVTGIMVDSIEEFRPHEAEGGGVEAGTSLRTFSHWDLGRRREEFMTRHPDFSWEEFHQKATGIFLKLQEAWSERDPQKCRPHETDVLFRIHRYWIEDNLRNRKINRLSNVQVERWELSNLVVDAYYESITTRVFASMIDVTTDESGTLLYGDPTRPRRFTEYWTFIRRVGYRPAKGDSLHQCPSCGAGLDKVNQSGVCEYCQTVVTLGDFDWVLTNIEQDEVYVLAQ